MSLYNEPMQWIREAVGSVLSQSFKEFEFVIICDRPQYLEAISYIETLQNEDDRIVFICNPENIGLTRSLNIGIKAARGEYIARMDADDICLPLRLEKQAAYMDAHPEINICATDAHIIDAEGKITRRNRYIKKTDPAELLISNILAHPSVMFRRSLLSLRDPFYNEEYRYSQDYELWQFLFLNGVLPHTLQEPLLLYRKSSNQVSAAQRSQQAECFKRAHRRLITDWLVNNKIIGREDCDDPGIMLQKASEAYGNIAEEKRHALAHIIYVLYFSIGTHQWKYRLLYLLDRNLVVFKVKFIFTFRLFFSSRTRKNKSGLI